MYRPKHARRRHRAPMAVTSLVVVVGLGAAWRAGALASLADALRHRLRSSPVASAAPGTPGAPSTVPLPSPSPVPADVLKREQAALARFARLGYPIVCGGGKKNLVALTFDDGPGPYTAQTLRILKAAGASATFFLVAKLLPYFPKAIPSAERALGAVGDHSWNHLYLPGLSSTSLGHEVADSQQAIEAASGGPVELFRPPYGALTASIERYVNALGMVPILWSGDSGDSHPGENPQQMYASAVAALRPGAIILFHENRGMTLQMLPAILQAAKDKGLVPVTVPYLLAVDPPSLAQLRTHTCFGRPAGPIPTSPPASQGPLPYPSHPYSPPPPSLAPSPTATATASPSASPSPTGSASPSPSPSPSPSSSSAPSFSFTKAEPPRRG